MSVDVVEDFGGFEKSMGGAMYQALDSAATISQSKIKILLGKHGVATSVAKQFGITDKARSSEPGQPPGLRTGSLRRSIQIDRKNNVGDRPFVLVGTNLVYGRIHELGGVHHPKRPFIVPGVKNSAAPIQKAVLAIFRSAAKKFRGIT